MTSREPIETITVEREYASGGGEIAAHLARRLGWELWDHALTYAIAKRVDRAIGDVAEQEERRDPGFYRLLKGFFAGSFEGSLHLPRLDSLAGDRMTSIACELIHEAANHGRSVIVGRGSAYCLQDHPGILHVFIYAPLEHKIRRLVADGYTATEAKRRAQSVDLDRAAFIREYFKKEWPERSLYHLMVNSAMGTETSVQLILDTVTLVSAPKSLSLSSGPTPAGGYPTLASK